MDDSGANAKGVRETGWGEGALCWGQETWVLTSRACGLEQDQARAGERPLWSRGLYIFVLLDLWRCSLSQRSPGVCGRGWGCIRPHGQVF